jgi:pyrimidine deaminase RibD-like protein
MPQPHPAPDHPAQHHLTQALAQAQAALLRASPNPRVGCVLVNPQGQRIGQGSTQQAGGPHAEVMALRDAQASGHATEGATAYVTLEPCCHQGRTGPCTEALRGAGIARVVAAVAGVGASDGCSATPAKSAEPSLAAAMDVAPASTTLPPACAAARLHESAPLPAPAPTAAQSVRHAGLADTRSPVKAAAAPRAPARGVLNNA